MATNNSTKIINDVSNTLKKFYSKHPLSNGGVNLYVRSDSESKISKQPPQKPESRQAKPSKEKTELKQAKPSKEKTELKQIQKQVFKELSRPQVTKEKNKPQIIKEQFDEDLEKKDKTTNIEYKKQSLVYLKGIFENINKKESEEPEKEVKKSKGNIWKLLMMGLSGLAGWLASGFQKLKGALGIFTPIINKLKSSPAFKFIAKWGDDILAKLKNTKIFKFVSSVFGKIKFFGSKVGGFIDDLMKPIKPLIKFFKGAGKAGKAIGKLGSLAKLGGIFGKFLGPILKKIPIIGSVFTIASAIKRFGSGDVLGGIIDIASAITGFIPGVGTAISIGLSLFNVARDKYKEKKLKKEKGPNLFEKFKNFVKPIIMSLPPFFQITQIGKGVESFKNGDFVGGLGYMWSAVAGLIPGVGPLLSLGMGFLNSDKGNMLKQKVKATPVGNFLSKLFDKIKKVINGLGQTISDVIMAPIKMIQDFFNKPNKTEQSDGTKNILEKIIDQAKNFIFGMIESLGLEDLIPRIKTFAISTIEDFTQPFFGGKIKDYTELAAVDVVKNEDGSTIKNFTQAFGGKIKDYKELTDVDVVKNEDVSIDEEATIAKEKNSAGFIKEKERIEDLKKQLEEAKTAGNEKKANEIKEQLHLENEIWKKVFEALEEKAKNDKTGESAISLKIYEEAFGSNKILDYKLNTF